MAKNASKLALVADEQAAANSIAGNTGQTAADAAPQAEPAPPAAKEEAAATPGAVIENEPAAAPEPTPSLADLIRQEIAYHTGNGNPFKSVRLSALLLKVEELGHELKETFPAIVAENPHSALAAWMAVVYDAL